MFDIFGKFTSVEEINITAKGLLKEGDIDNLKILANENGLEDMVDLFVLGQIEDLTDSFMAAVGRLNVEVKTEEVTKLQMEIPAEPIVEYLQSICTEKKIANAIMNKEKDLNGCLKYIKTKAKELVTRNKPYLADMVVFQMAADYYTK